ncbi:MAG TPA: MFS transporter, partial [Streptomyces sp.]
MTTTPKHDTTSGTPAASPAENRRWAVLAICCVAAALLGIDNSVLNYAIPSLSRQLGPSSTQLLWIVDIYGFVLGGMLVVAGNLGDRIGRKKLLLMGVTGFGVASALTAYADSPGMLIAARALLGLAGATIMPSTLSLVRSAFSDPKERTTAIGISSGVAAASFALGPVVGGLLLDHFWWGSVFLINVPVTAVGIVAAAILVPESRNREAGGIDFVGVLLSIAGLVLLVYGIVEGGDSASWLHLGVIGPIVGGLAVLAVFAWYEARIQHPSLDVRLFRDRRLSASIGSLGLVFFGMGGVFFFTSFYLQNVRGYTPLAAGLLTVPFAAGQ